jgi:membrane protease YdiL (CAAX protease family)
LRLFRAPFRNTGFWITISLILIFILRFGHLLRGIPGAMLALSAQVLCLLIVVLMVEPQSRERLGFVRFEKKWWLVSIIGGLILGAGLALLNRFVLPPSWDWIVAMDRSLLPDVWRGLPFGLTEVGLALIGGVLTPLAEEFFFRGLLLSAWEKSVGVWPALILQALLFAFLHLAHVGVEVYPCFAVNPGLAANIFAATLIGGVIFGLIRVRSGSIWLAVITHSAVNLGAAIL